MDDHAHVPFLNGHEQDGVHEQDGAAHDFLRSKNLRIALYSHDTMGIGHMRRNALIARTISCAGISDSILMVAGAREAATLALPTGTDCLTLPSYFKEPGGKYQSRHLGVSLSDLVALRAKTIAAALEAFRPDLLIVDKVPRGALRELDPALELLHARGKTRCVLGLRDILDDPATVRREWSDGAHEDAICDYYDAVWVYGDPAVYDQVREYEYPEAVAEKVRYTGYLMRPVRTVFSEFEDAEMLPLALSSSDRLHLCMVGGGQDGGQLAKTFAQVEFSPGTRGVIVTGPFMPPEVQQCLCRLAASKPRLSVLKVVADPDVLLSRADRVVVMGGYNTVCEVLSFGKRALIVPREKPRREQFIRAERLHDMGLVDMLRPDDVNPQVLTEWLTRERESPAGVNHRIDFNGAANLPRLLDEVLACPSGAGHNGFVERTIYHDAV